MQRLDQWVVHYQIGRYAHENWDEIMKVKFLILIVLIIAGCTYRGAYEGIQTSNRFECSKLPLSQYDECMENANKSYDEYERERKEALGQ